MADPVTPLARILLDRARRQTEYRTVRRVVSSVAVAAAREAWAWGVIYATERPLTNVHGVDENGAVWAENYGLTNAHWLEGYCEYKAANGEKG